MEFLSDTGAFIVVLGVMIFFHEFGHFAVAKLFGMRVFVFSFGFGRRLFGFKWGDTDCRVSLVPLGGYVKLEGEPDDVLSEDVPQSHDERDFTARPRWQRFVVYLAGPFMNGVLSVALMAGLYMYGIGVPAALYDRPIIGVVDDGSPAAAAGLLPGDEIVKIDGRPQASWEEAGFALLVRPDTTLRLTIRRGGELRDVELRSGSTKEMVGTIGVYPLVRIGAVIEKSPAEAAGLRPDDAIVRIGDQPIRSFEDIVPIVAESKGQPLELHVFRDGKMRTVAVAARDDGSGLKIGVGPKMVLKQFGPVAAVGAGLSWAVSNVRQTVDILYRLVTARISPKTMMGPLGIAQVSGEAARIGIAPLLSLMAVISLQLGILNLLPVPPLDGGHLAILAGEGVLRRDFSMAVKAWILNTGFALLLLLIGLVLYSDLSKTSLFSRFLQ
jgi:regulator of sigma E protease